LIETLRFFMLHYTYFPKSEMTDELKEQLVTTYHITPLDLEDVYTDTQLSKFERRPEYIYVALQFPEFDKVEETFVTKEVHCFVSNEYFIVIDKDDFRQLQRFELHRQSDLAAVQNSFVLFYEMLDYVITRLFRAMRKFSREVDDLENELFTSGKTTDKDFIFDIQVIKRNLINFISLVAPLEDVVIDLQAHYERFVKEGEDRVELLDDSLDKIKKMRNNLKNFVQQMTLISETNEALIARNTNQVIKLMTATSIMVIFPSFIAAFFGMNVYLGWDVTVPNYAPLVTAIVAIVVSVTAIFAYFKKQKWL
jgi:magnesium transporter